jgi:hypothetical protein
VIYLDGGLDITSYPVCNFVFPHHQDYSHGNPNLFFWQVEVGSIKGRPQLPLTGQRIANKMDKFFHLTPLFPWKRLHKRSSNDATATAPGGCNNCQDNQLPFPPFLGIAEQKQGSRRANEKNKTIP